MGLRLFGISLFKIRSQVRHDRLLPVVNRGEITSDTHLFSAIYRGLFYPFKNWERPIFWRTKTQDSVVSENNGRLKISRNRLGRVRFFFVWLSFLVGWMKESIYVCKESSIAPGQKEKTSPKWCLHGKMHGVSHHLRYIESMNQFPKCPSNNVLFPKKKECNIFSQCICFNLLSFTLKVQPPLFYWLVYEAPVFL